MKKIPMLIFIFMLCALLFSCGNYFAQKNYEREKKAAQYTSEYARSVNKLELDEGNFNAYRRVVFYNVRLGEVIFVCEGYAHVKIDEDGDVEVVIKLEDGEYLRHYLGQKTDITYFSEQLEASKIADTKRYKIIWNPNIWIPEFEVQ